MPHFTLYNLNPEFWAKVQAKAKAEHTTPKAVILQLLTTWLGVLALALLTVSCTTPYEPTPLPKTPIVVAPPPPASTPLPVPPLSVSLSIGMGSPEVGDRLSFVASAGTPIARAAWSFGNGATSTTNDGSTSYAYPATGTFTASVTVTASDGRTGSDAATVTVRRRDTPPPPPTPTPDPGPNTSGFGVSVTCTPPATGRATPCQVTVTHNGVVQPSGTVSAVSWDFGDGETSRTTKPVTSHVYVSAGSYTVFAAVEATAGAGTASTTITIP